MVFPAPTFDARNTGWRLQSTTAPYIKQDAAHGDVPQVSPGCGCLQAMDDSVLEIRARLHNYPELPLFLRKLLGFGLSTMAPLAAGVLKYTPWYNEGTPEPETRYRSE